ncbi:MAG: SufE family protein [Candidatus Competibacteraceae bacterium]|nr:SufE family protein [Candidatus Competibacteraceae bacterium]
MTLMQVKPELLEVEVAESLTAANRRPIEDAITMMTKNFAVLDDWTERYRYLIDLGRQLPHFPEAWRTRSNQLRGCQSQVWIVGIRSADRLYFRAVSDAAIVSGLIALLLEVYDGRRAEEILTTSPEFLKTIGLYEHLSPSRGNGLHALVQFIRGFAKCGAGGQADKFRPG